jgi:hypothetical protein
MDTGDTQTFEQAVEKLVNWWADKSFNTLLNQNNGDESETGGIAFMLMNILSMESQKSVTPQQIELFKQKLAELLLKTEGNYISIGTDYHPDRVLSEACSFAEINTSCIPIKSHSWIERGGAIRSPFPLVMAVNA